MTRKINENTYIGDDGQFYGTWNEMVGANTRYHQQERQNKLLEEQNELLRKQEVRQKESEPKMSYSLTEYNEIMKDERMENFRKLSIKTLKNKLNQRNSKLNDIKDKIRIIELDNKLRNRSSAIRTLFILIEVILIIASIISYSTTLKIFSVAIGGLFIIISIIDLANNKSKLNKEFSKIDMEEYEDLPENWLDLLELKSTVREEIKEINEIIEEKEDLEATRIKEQKLKEKSKGEDIFKKERSKNKKKMKDKTDIIFSLDKEE